MRRGGFPGAFPFAGEYILYEWYHYKRNALYHLYFSDFLYLCYAQNFKDIMDILRINQHKKSFDAIQQFIKSDDGSEQIEVWFARELQDVLGYARWENFTIVIGRAVESCSNQGVTVDDHFREVTKMVTLGSGAKREIQDFMLTRYACYLIAQIPITKEHIQNNQSVRQMLGQRGIKPEELPAAEDIKKVERRVTSNEKRIEKTTKKLPKSK